MKLVRHKTIEAGSCACAHCHSETENHAALNYDGHGAALDCENCHDTVGAHGAACDGCSCSGEHGEIEKEEIRWIVIRLGIAAALFAAAILIPESIWKTLIFASSYLVAGYPVLLHAGKNILSRKLFDETLLMTIATVGAAALGEFAEAAAVMLLFGLGELLQGIAVGKTKRSISALLELRPDSATRLVDGRLETVDPADVAIGDIIIVKPFERLPLDGEVIDGESFVDQRALTGESVPVRAAAGNTLLAGGINGEGALTMRVIRVYADSAVNKIIRMTEEAAKQRSPREQFITRFARVYTPAVVALAVLIAVVPPLLGLGVFSEWLYLAMTLLVISCPCALVISVPLAFFAGLGGASRAGLLIRGSAGLEALAKTGAVAFDKTGTLTQGTFTVTSILPQPGIEDREFLELCALAELYSTHPIGRALVAHCEDLLDSGRIEDFVEIRGRGVSAKIDGMPVLAGSEKLLTENGVAVTGERPAGSAVYLARGGEYLGCAALGDILKPDAIETIRILYGMGIKTIMLTGDAEIAAMQAAKELGIDEYYAGLLPGDKVDRVRALKQSVKGTTAFVGDGINDAPVIASADVGISMGGLGSDAAIEASDVVLMTDEPSRLPIAIRHARRTLSIVSQNIGLSLGIKGAIILLGFFGISSMWLAIVADVGTALLAVANSIRALRVPKE